MPMRPAALRRGGTGPEMMSRHKAYRQITRTTLRRPFRCLSRTSLRGRRRGPDDLSQALTAFGRAIRAQRQLARLAPSFFDSAVRDRNAENRAEQRRWMATWEPHIAAAYGVEPRPPRTDDELPRLPSAKIQRKVEFKLAEREMCMVAGHEAMERYRQRQPHAVMSWIRMVRLLKIGFDFGNLACGLEIINPLPEKITHDYELTGLKRSYGLEPQTPAVAGGAGGRRASADNGGASGLASHSPSEGNPPSVPAAGASGLASRSPSADLAPAAPSPPLPPRCDAWSRWARTMRRMRS
jgi:hypothetical protein